MLPTLRWTAKDDVVQGPLVVGVRTLVSLATDYLYPNVKP
jgi:hypothetical protein